MSSAGSICGPTSGAPAVPRRRGRTAGGRWAACAEHNRGLADAPPVNRPLLGEHHKRGAGGGRPPELQPRPLEARGGKTALTYSVLKLIHIVGAILIGAGLLGVWISDLRSRQSRELPQFSEAVRNIAVFYDGLVVPGALLLLASGTWLIVEFFGGWGFLNASWLAGMVLLFAFEFIEGNTVTRLYFMRLRRLTKEALAVGEFTTQLEQARAERVPTFTHFLDLPILFVIVSLGTLKPDTWTLFAVGVVIAIGVATSLTLLVPRLYPWGSTQKSSVSPHQRLERGC